MTPRIEVTVAASINDVWTALRDRDQIRNWHGWDFDGLDAEIDLIYFQHFTESPVEFQLSVQDGDEIRLTTEGDGTRVVLTRAPRGDDPEWAAFYDDVTEGWITFLNQLRFAIERHPGQPRQTVFLTGEPGTTGSPIDALGLSGTAELPAGSTYDAEVVGESISGTVWFRSEHQLGLTVDAWGDGLLVLSEIEPSEHKPNGSTTAVLSTYGLDEAAHASLSERWTAWWTRPGNLR